MRVRKLLAHRSELKKLEAFMTKPNAQLVRHACVCVMVVSLDYARSLARSCSRVDACRCRVKQIPSRLEIGETGWIKVVLAQCYKLKTVDTRKRDDEREVKRQLRDW